MAPEELYLQAQDLMRHERWESAIGLIEALPVEQRSAALNWSHGWALFKLEDFERAARSLRLAVAQEPGNPVSHWALGVVLKEGGDCVAAETHLLKALSIKDSGLARCSLALIYMEQGRLEEAERIHLDGLERKPSDRERVEAYADFLSDCGREKEATAAYARAETLPEKRRSRPAR